jgi:hypothetical protein
MNEIRENQAGFQGFRPFSWNFLGRAAQPPIKTADASAGE